MAHQASTQRLTLVVRISHRVPVRFWPSGVRHMVRISIKEHALKQPFPQDPSSETAQPMPQSRDLYHAMLAAALCHVIMVMYVFVARRGRLRFSRSATFLPIRSPYFPTHCGMAGNGAVEIGGGMADYEGRSWTRRVRSRFSFSIPPFSL